MSNPTRGRFLGAMAAFGVMLLLTVWLANGAAQPMGEAEPAEAAPPEGQTYTGAKKCSSCHFEQYMSWKKTKHAKAFESLTEKYQADEKCLACHTTGYGRDTGFKDAATSANLAGVTCETCHGPGSKHDEVCQAFAKKKKLSPEEDKVAKDSIYKILPGNVCSKCHVVQGHKKSLTPKELQPQG